MTDRKTTASVAVVRSVAVQVSPMLGASSSAAGKASTTTMDPWAAAKWYIVTKALGRCCSNYCCRPQIAPVPRFPVPLLRTDLSQLSPPYSVPGMKVMLLDNATSATVGLVCSQSQALEFQVGAYLETNVSKRVLLSNKKTSRGRHKNIVKSSVNQIHRERPCAHKMAD